jgi:hypothetical protein
MVGVVSNGRIPPQPHLTYDKRPNNNHLFANYGGKIHGELNHTRKRIKRSTPAALKALMMA